MWTSFKLSATYFSSFIFFLLDRSRSPKPFLIHFLTGNIHSFVVYFNFEHDLWSTDLCVFFFVLEKKRRISYGLCTKLESFWNYYFGNSFSRRFSKQLDLPKKKNKIAHNLEIDFIFGRVSISITTASFLKLITETRIRFDQAHHEYDFCLQKPQAYIICIGVSLIFCARSFVRSIVILSFSS